MRPDLVLLDKVEGVRCQTSLKLSQTLSIIMNTFYKSPSYNENRISIFFFFAFKEIFF